MTEDPLSAKIKSLTIDDDSLSHILTKFNTSSSLTKEEQVELHNQLLKESQNPDSSKILYELLLDVPGEFIKKLQRVNDVSGNILINVLNKNKATDALVQDILSNLRSLMKSSTTEDIPFYLGIYSSLVTHLNITNTQHLNLFLTFVDGKDHDVQQSVLVLIVQNLKIQKSETSEIVKEYLEVLMEENSLSSASFLNFVLVQEMCFPVIPEICSPIYQNDRTKSHLLEKITSILEGNYLQLTIPILKLIGSSCIVENCRNYNVKNYLEFLVKGCEINNNEIQVASSLNLTKLWKTIQFERKSTDDITVQQLATNFINYLKLQIPDFEYLELSVEGLMYLTLYWEVRELIRMDVVVIDILLSKLEETSTSSSGINTTLQYGLLSTFSNLTKVKDINDRQSNMNSKKQLKNVATPKDGSDSDKENQEGIMLFNRELLDDDKIVSKIVALKSYKSTHTSKNTINEVIKIVYHLSTDQKKSTRVELVKQGAVNIILNYLINFSEIKKQDHLVYAVPNVNDSDIVECRVFAIRSLARMLISVDPQNVFTKYDIRTAIPFLKELLGPDISQYQESNFNSESYLHDMTLLDRFESLLALTNIAATTNSELKNFLIQQLFESYLDNFIVATEDTEIQQASWELIANLITQPLMLAKFFNLEVPSNKKRLDLLIKLLNSVNASLQVVVAGLLTNATDFDMIVETLVSDDAIFNQLLNIICDILLDEINNEKLVLPTLYLLVNLTYAAANTNQKVFNSLSTNTKLKSACTNILRSGNSECKEVVIEVIKMCQFK
ncbi:SHE4 SWI5-dependent HO expression protein 4 [Candida maltosa Xu316]|uniref:UNC-45/Cro1/She4 central domain-containing protein n=1 Tax=Candida maltosa (strain Xu316) TaxID=1245528 RepID=M3IWJ4_CANMX|nr:hypothetical protein G210_4706 [Candida maltosa Xu316]